MEVIRRGASFVRFQTTELDWMQEPGDDDFRVALRLVAAGRMATPFSCFAVDDVLSPGWESALAAAPLEATATGKAETETPPRLRMAQAARRLIPGLLSLRPSLDFFCNAHITDSRNWDSLRISKYELQEEWAATLARKRVLLVLGEKAPPTSSLLPVLRGTQEAAALHVDSSSTRQGFDELVGRITEQIPSFDLALVMGLDPGLGALLVVALDCYLQVLDLGSFHPIPASPRVVLPSNFLTHCGATLCQDPNPWDGPEFHPRPQLRRSGGRWLNLNGLWEVHIGLASAESVPSEFSDGHLQVPFPAESELGRLRRRISEHEALWLRREVFVPAEWSGALLHVDACDWQCVVYVDGRQLGAHQGGYDPFAIDISSALQAAAPEAGQGRRIEITIQAWDPTDSGCEYQVTPPVPCRKCCRQGWQPRGKQSLQPGFIMYSAVTGPWQTVWLEEARHQCMLRTAQVVLLNGPEAAQGQAGSLRLEGQLEEARGPCSTEVWLSAKVLLHGRELASGLGKGSSTAGGSLALEMLLPGPIELWSPASPTLYTGLLSLCQQAPAGGGPICGDVVEMSFGLRWLSLSSGAEAGPKMERDLLLNGQRLFQHGVLYQAYWPESLLTPPGHAALAQEIRQIKESGFNLIRVHAAVMPPLFYSLCDQLGVLVWQDFPGGDGRALPLWDHARASVEEVGSGVGSALEMDEIERTEESALAFWRELQAMVAWLSAFACIVCWIPFNEAWGQFQTMQVVRWLRDHGGGRWINAASGWNDVGDLFPDLDAGDLADVHNYEGPPFNLLNNTFSLWPLPFTNRALALGEYGGLGLSVQDHEWRPDLSWAYGVVPTTPQELGRDLLALGGRLAALLCQSRVSAAVYTQWNDIETEVNGLVTYDRVPKLETSVLLEFSSLLAEAYQRCQPSAASDER